MRHPEAATGVRYQVIGAATAASLLLYIDRICIAEIAKLNTFQTDLGLTAKETGAILSAFFLTYALGQVPAGWLADRLGARVMLPVYVLTWSLCTMLTGLANGFMMLMAVRLLFGFSQAGCYPAASSLIRRWIPPRGRGTASSFVTFGGRLGGAVAPLLTAWLIADVMGWRGVLMAYGLCGLAVAFLFYRMVRESPHGHPGCNHAERELIRDGREHVGEEEKPRLPPLWPLVRSPTLWAMCALQYGINVGWVFLVTWLPKYLQDVKQVDSRMGGLMSTLVLFAGIAGVLAGGPLADAAARRLGRRWGRSIPMVCCYVLAVAAYLSCLRLESAWGFVAAAALVAFATDLSLPAIWAHMQDIGGKNAAAVFGWGNMWGNLGAATTPLLVPVVLERWDANGDWHEAFLLFSAGYMLAAVSALMINAEKPVE